MKLNEYQQLAGRTRNTHGGFVSLELGDYALGLVCEAGEAGDIIKKVVFHGHEINNEELKKELGDTLWYLANLCSVLGYSLEEVAEMNIEKLKKRYPQGFNVNDSINRTE
jgi:NTP pyrophosphatase (non-canonical NTP hydrolase)